MQMRQQQLQQQQQQRPKSPVESSSPTPLEQPSYKELRKARDSMEIGSMRRQQRQQQQPQQEAAESLIRPGSRFDRSDLLFVLYYYYY